MLVSAFAFGGVPQRALQHLAMIADLYVSPELLREYRDVPSALLADRKISMAQWQALVIGIASVVAQAKVVRARHPVTLCRDPEDNMILECCHAARADVLLTGDKDLLDLALPVLQTPGFARLRIINPRTYLESAPLSS